MEATLYSLLVALVLWAIAWELNKLRKSRLREKAKREEISRLYGAESSSLFHEPNGWLSEILNAPTAPLDGRYITYVAPENPPDTRPGGTSTRFSTMDNDFSGSHMRSSIIPVERPAAPPPQPMYRINRF